MITNLVSIKFVEYDPNEGEYTETKHRVFSSIDDARKFFDKQFELYCKFYDVDVLSKYDFKNDKSFHLQENTSGKSYGDWYIDGKILEVAEDFILNY